MEALYHMASKVEALLGEKPELHLDTAIKKAHAGLGIFGLATFEDAIINGFRTSSRKRFKENCYPTFGDQKCLYC
jgi:hypothetical protein